MKNLQMLLCAGLMVVGIPVHGMDPEGWNMLVLANDVRAIGTLVTQKKLQKYDVKDHLVQCMMLPRPDLVAYFLEQYSFSPEDFEGEVYSQLNFFGHLAEGSEIKNILEKHRIVMPTATGLEDQSADVWLEDTLAIAPLFAPQLEN